MWVEKYRPKLFSEVIGQSPIIERLRAFVEHKNIPHLMFAGPPGVGKSTLALVIARELFGESWRENFLELNASNDRGIDVVRNQVKDFARTKSIGGVPFKLIFLDEADALTKEAQQALRRTMESFTSATRFILSCNYGSKIIEPIQSRCVVFKFKPLSKDEVFQILEKVSAKEDLQITPEGKQALYDVCEGDCRKLENILQSCASVSKSITPDRIFSLASLAEPKEIKEVLEFALKGEFSTSKNKLLDVMLKQGLSGADIIKQVQKEVWSLALDDKKKLDVVVKCGEVEFHLVEGSDDFVQLESLLAYLALVNSK